MRELAMVQSSSDEDVMSAIGRGIESGDWTEFTGIAAMSVWQCPCTEIHFYSLKPIPCPVNPALETHLISNESFAAGRKWFAEHRSHGKAVQII